jgi:hypothetical protein
MGMHGSVSGEGLAGKAGAPCAHCPALAGLADRRRLPGRSDVVPAAAPDMGPSPGWACC